MMLLLYFSLSLAVYSPELYHEQTRHCLFTQEPTAAGPEALNSLLKGNIQAITRRYPLSSPRINEDVFLKKLSLLYWRFGKQLSCSKHYLPVFGFAYLTSLELQNYSTISNKKYHEQ